MLKALTKAPLSSFRILQIVIAGICIFIPVILRMFDHDTYYRVRIDEAGIQQVENCRQTVALTPPAETEPATSPSTISLKLCDSETVLGTFSKIPRGRFGFRESLSNYTYGSASHLYGFLYCLAAGLFLYNGVSYMKKNALLRINRNGQWYNLFTGIFLAGVVFCPQFEYPFLHNLFTILFFAGNTAAMLFAGNPGESRLYKIIRMLMAIFILAVLWFTFKTKRLSVLEAEWIALTLFGIHLIMVTLTAESGKNLQPESSTS